SLDVCASDLGRGLVDRAGQVAEPAARDPVAPEIRAGMTLTAERLLDALARSAATRYGGEIVSELEHALQCAELAREADADDDLQLACLLHDVGRFAVDKSLVSDQSGRESC